MATISKEKAALRAYALGLPEAYEDFPWGERVAKVNKKVFVFLGMDTGEVGIGVKLPDSGAAALELPFTEPSGYGLGKAGWVSVKLPPGEEAPLELLREWILESYIAVAPKRLSKALRGEPPVIERKEPKKQPPAKRASANAVKTNAKKPPKRG